MNGPLAQRSSGAARITYSFRTLSPRIPEVGVAARACGVGDVPVARGDSRTLRMVLPQTYVPVPGTADHVVLVSGTSPVPDLAEAFHDVSDAVKSTFRFV